MTLDQFKTKVQPALDIRLAIQGLEQQLQAMVGQRCNIDKEALSLVNLVVHAVKGDPEEGDDGMLYEAMGYIRKSNRRSGLHRKVVPLTDVAKVA